MCVPEVYFVYIRGTCNCIAMIQIHKPVVGPNHSLLFLFLHSDTFIFHTNISLGIPPADQLLDLRDRGDDRTQRKVQNGGNEIINRLVSTSFLNEIIKICKFYETEIIV